MSKALRIKALLLALIISFTSISFFQPCINAQAGVEQLTNLVVFVNFSDTTHAHGELLYGCCFLDNPKTEELFNSTDYALSMKAYFRNISYGRLDVTSVFPQLNTETNTVAAVTLPQNTYYYASNFGTPDLLVNDTIAAIKDSVPTSINLDANGDSLLDNLMIVVPYDKDNYGSSFYGLHSNFSGSATINGKKVSDYTIITEYGAYMGIEESGLPIHEFMHTLGYRDLYANRGDTTCVPVYTWDIESTVSKYLAFPLAYQRYSVSGWIDIPTVTANQSAYSLYSPTATLADGASTSIRDRQAVILKTPYSSSEFFVVEYRQKAPASYAPGYDAYDQKIPGSGLIIYRVNTNNPYLSNRSDKPYYIYVFRPEDSYVNGKEAASGAFAKSFLSQESGRTEYGSSDISASLEDGAITYSDGHNSGIVISNVGSASGDKITFDITFADTSSLGYWTTETEYAGASFSQVNSCMDADGNVYAMVYGLNSGSYSYSLYFYNGTSWNRLGAAPANAYNIALAFYKGKLYCLSVSPSGLQLSVWNSSGNSWTKVYSNASIAPNCLSLTQSDDILYFACDGDSSKNVYAFSYDGFSVKPVGSTVGNASYASNIAIVAGNGNIVVLYRDFLSSNKITIKKYSSAASVWTDISTSGLSATVARPVLDLDTLYWVSYSGTAGGAYLYKANLATASPALAKVSTAPYRADTIYDADIRLINGTPYIVFANSSKNTLNCVKYESGSFPSVGTAVADSISEFNTFFRSGSLYVVSVNPNQGQLFIKSKQISTAAATATPTPTTKPTVTPTPTTKPTTTPTPTTKPMVTPTPTTEPAATPTPTTKPTVTPTPTTEPAATPTPTTKPTTKPTATPTPTTKPTVTPTPTTEPAATPTPTPTTEPAATPTPTPTTAPAATPTPTTWPGITPTAITSPTATASPTATPVPATGPVTTPTLTTQPVATPTPTPQPVTTPTPVLIPTENPSVTLEPTAGLVITSGPVAELTESPTVTINPSVLPKPTEPIISATPVTPKPEAGSSTSFKPLPILLGLVGSLSLFIVLLLFLRHKKHR